MSQVRGITDLGIFPVLGRPNLNIKVDRAKAARYGLNSGDVNSLIQATMGAAYPATKDSRDDERASVGGREQRQQIGIVSSKRRDRRRVLGKDRARALPAMVKAHPKRGRQCEWQVVFHFR